MLADRFDMPYQKRRGHVQAFSPATTLRLCKAPEIIRGFKGWGLGSGD